MKKELSSRQLRAIHAKKQGDNWSEIIPFNRKNIALLENEEGNYELFNREQEKLYVGSSYNGIKHRLQSYYELDSKKVHPTKVDLRPKIKFFRFRYLPIEQARVHERNIKQGLPYNMDSKQHEQRKEIRREKI